MLVLLDRSVRVLSPFFDVRLFAFASLVALLRVFLHALLAVLRGVGFDARHFWSLSLSFAGGM